MSRAVTTHNTQGPTVASVDQRLARLERIMQQLTNLGGDLSGQLPNPTVNHVNGVAVPLTSSAWIAPTFINSWANVSAAVAAGYLKDPMGFVHLKGRIMSGAVNTSAFVLPTGYRPGNDGDYYPMIYGGFVTQLAAVIFNNGVVQISAPSGTTVTDASLGGITFLAEH